jgi:hypothetical protein
VLIRKSKLKRRSKLRLLNIEKFSCRFKKKKLKLRSFNLSKVIKLPPKKLESKLKLKKHSRPLNKEVMLKRLLDSKLYVIKKHVKQMKLQLKLLKMKLKQLRSTNKHKNLRIVKRKLKWK